MESTKDSTLYTSSNHVSNKYLKLKVAFIFLIITTKSCKDEPKHETTSAHFHFLSAAVLFCGGVQKAVKKTDHLQTKMTLCMCFKLEPQECICDASAALSQTYCMFSGAGNKKLLRINTIISGWFQQETEENTSTDFSLSSTKSNRCFCCCNWHKREKQFDLLSLSLKSAYLNLIFHLSLLVVKSEFGMQLRDYKKKLKKKPKATFRKIQNIMIIMKYVFRLSFQMST